MRGLLKVFENWQEGSLKVFDMLNLSIIYLYCLSFVLVSCQPTFLNISVNFVI